MFIQLTDDDTGQLFDVAARFVVAVRTLSATKTEVMLSGIAEPVIVRETRHKVTEKVRAMFEGGR